MQVINIYLDNFVFMEEKDIKEEEILDENITENTEDVDSLLKSTPQKFNLKDEEMEDQMVNKQDDGVDKRHVGERYSHSRRRLGAYMTDEKRVDDVI